jgi:hypothetical protein
VTRSATRTRRGVSCPNATEVGPEKLMFNLIQQNFPTFLEILRCPITQFLVFYSLKSQR